MKIFSKKILAVSVLLAAGSSSTAVMAGTTAAVSVTPLKIVGNGASADVSLSKGGLHSAFESDATNLVLGDSNLARDIFFRLGVSTISRISVNSLGQEAKNTDVAVSWFDTDNHADSNNPAISSDGKLVVFESQANNLDRLTQDTNNDVVNNANTNTGVDIFLRDVAKKKTYRLSGVLDGADGVTPGQLDVDGNPVLSIDAPWKVMVQGNERSSNPAIAGTAKQAWVAFESKATNLSSLTTTTGRTHIYLVDLKTKKTELISATHDPVTGVPLVESGTNAFAPAISPDGRFVVYQSTSTNLVTSPATQPNGSIDIFIYDRKLFATYQLSGLVGAISPTGGYTIATEADDDSSAASITGGGKSKTKSYMIAFESRATDLDVIPGADTDGDRDVFVVEFAAIDPKNLSSAFEIKSVKRISAPVDSVTGLISGPAADQGDDTAADNRAPVIAGTNLAYKVAFRSTADNLLSDPLSLYWNIDSNETQDTYVYTNTTRTFDRANVDVAGVQGTFDSNNPTISPDGKAVGFDTSDEFLVPELFGNDATFTQAYVRKL
jgi:hypothetical protein